MIETLIFYGSIYGALAFFFSLLYAFLYGMIDRTWRIKDLLPGLFFPWGVSNELGNIVKRIIIKVRDKRGKEASKK